ncbi:E3 ubiquitin-protein ligase UBR3 [Manis javanica]|nr:E3 ubiquitin-protein ligase UBR3 [Manis javanica]
MNMWCKHSWQKVLLNQLFHVLALHMRLYSIDSEYNPWRKLTQFLEDMNSQQGNEEQPEVPILYHDVASLLLIQILMVPQPLHKVSWPDREREPRRDQQNPVWVPERLIHRVENPGAEQILEVTICERKNLHICSIWVNLMQGVEVNQRRIFPLSLCDFAWFGGP